ncbi:Wall-associated receptor kinase [Vigna unguiculata]|uniref:Wall-associated receptor kinase n=1 Tax=Vigna unguiculata TaxID=3917 RepID=A0A4D6MGD5_VIGUN|nr:Wall-associated receptor kinase [Vigna unguiculata]
MSLDSADNRIVETEKRLGVSMWIERALIVLVLLLHQIDGGDGCLASSCGKIRNISYPFRLKVDPECGPYELSCENNITLLSLLSGRFNVEDINYNNFTMRVVDPGLQQSNCSSLPRYFLSTSNFTDSHTDTLDMYENIYEEEYYQYQYIVFLSCSHGVSGKRKYVDTGGCLNWDSKGYTYAMAGDLLTKDLEVGCDVKLVALTSWWGLNPNNYSYAMMHTALVYGFYLSWIRLVCEHTCGFDNHTYCHFNDSTHSVQCLNDGMA